jgi:uncharacterized repeat protein (TIGR01451 family)
MRSPKNRLNILIAVMHTRQLTCLGLALVGLTGWITLSGYLTSVAGERSPALSVSPGIVAGTNPRALPAQIFTVTNINDTGGGSLRDAINLANADSVMDTINFNITSGCHPTTGVCTIAPASPLPTITQPVEINGYTQPGASENTLAVGNNAVLLIELKDTVGILQGLNISTSNSTVKGLIVNSFDDNGIFIPSGSNNFIQGNFIGTDATGTVDLGNLSCGVRLDGGAVNNTVGGTAPGLRNVISGNNVFGVCMVNGSFGNTVQNNYIGTDISGALTVGNGAVGNANSSGVLIDNRTNNTVTGNLISGNNSSGVQIRSDFPFPCCLVPNKVQGNLIGTKANGTEALGNASHGVHLVGAGPRDHSIGGTVPGEGNTIAFNGGDGVFLDTGTGIGNRILGNSIFSNAGLGIDLFPDGVTPNDVGPPHDTDGGPNNLQNFPVLTSAASGNTVTITGTLNSTPSTGFTLEFFSNPACDSSGHGEGQTFLGTHAVTTDGSGNAIFTATFTSAVPAGHFITATATDPSNNTSEFSECETVQADTDDDAIPDSIDPDDDNDGLPDASDNCQFVSNFAIPQADTDGDGIGDACDGDDDNDGIPDSCAPAPPQMVSWWPAEGNANDIQDGNNGTFQGVNPQFAPGKVGQAFSFDGNDYVNVPHSSNLDIRTAVTLDTWIQTPITPNNIQVIAGKVGLYQLHTLADGRIRFNPATVGAPAVVDSTSTIPANTFIHVAATYDSLTGQANIYINGVLENTAVGSGMINSANNPFQIGAFFIPSSINCCFFNGLIDEVEVFNRALSHAEIQAIYNAGLAGKCRDGFTPDNCPLDDNADQTDTDDDGMGDVCDPDDDNDGIADGSDNCPLDHNPNQENNDIDSFGDACDPDDDNDGSPDAEDCEPFNPAVHPGATETCNNFDDNCNSQVDEGVSTTFYRDADGDGYGNPNISQQACSPPSGYVANNTDCNDSNTAINPGATEIPCNGIDDDCDNVIDEGGSPPTQADLEMDKSAPGTVLIGQNFTYRLEVENDGPKDATCITISDTLPVGLNFVSASAGCSYNASSHTVTCFISKLEEDDDVIRNITVQANNAGTFTNTASVSGNVIDSQPSDNSDSATTKVVNGVASVVLNPNSIKGGNNVTGTVNLVAPAQGNVVVTLSSSNTSVAKPTVNSITIPNGQSSGQFTVRTFRVSSTKTVKIKASANGTSKEATLTVMR